MKHLTIRWKILTLLTLLLAANAAITFNLLLAPERKDSQPPAATAEATTSQNLTRLRLLQLEHHAASDDASRKELESALTQLADEVKEQIDNAAEAAGGALDIERERTRTSWQNYLADSSAYLDLIHTAQPAEASALLLGKMKKDHAEITAATLREAAETPREGITARAELLLQHQTTLEVLAAAFLLATLLTAWLLSRSIARPAGRLRQHLMALQRGDWDESAPDTDRRDEFGDIAASLEELRQMLKNQPITEAPGTPAPVATVALAETPPQAIAALQQARHTNQALSATTRDLQHTLVQSASSAASLGSLLHELAATLPETLGAAEPTPAPQAYAPQLTNTGFLAERLKLLAINATIEASRMENSGAFAQVIEEIQTLAAATGNAAGEITPRPQHAAPSTTASSADRTARIHAAIATLAHLSRNTGTLRELLGTSTTTARQISTTLSALEAEILTAETALTPAAPNRAAA